MLSLRCIIRPRNAVSSKPLLQARLGKIGARTLLTLAIETSCDDTSVALLSKHSHLDVRKREHDATACLLYHKRVTANNRAYRGIHPVASLESHERTLGGLVREAITHIPTALRSFCPSGQATTGGIDLISVTRGPGMRASLNTGLNMAKGLALAFDIPLVGVHHMQAHALTPRMVSALNMSQQGQGTVEGAAGPLKPAFPFLTLLVSGGHTLLVESRGLTNHAILAETADIAIGDAIDKMARLILPDEIISTSDTVMYGAVLERFAFPGLSSAPTTLDAGFFDYNPPATRQAELARHETGFGWSLPTPLTRTKSGSKIKSMEFSFTGLFSAVQRIRDSRLAEGEFHEGERRCMAQLVMKIAFEHLAGRICMALGKPDDGEDQGQQEQRPSVESLVVGGGVAANRLRAYLDQKGHHNTDVVFPPLEFCTDNAAMIGWAGLEMFEAGWESGLECQAIHKWSLDSAGPDGGIVGVSDWKRR